MVHNHGLALSHGLYRERPSSRSVRGKGVQPHPSMDGDNKN